MKATGIVLLLLTLASCHTPTEKWLDGMSDYQSVKGKSLTLEIMKIKPVKEDTTAITYKIRLYPGKEWMENYTGHQKTGLFYSMDSCFVLRTATASYSPDMVQPVNNGIAGCYEYLLSFGIVKAMKHRQLQLVYTDKYIDGKPYQIILNR
ncbi:hypothetical protein [Mucilaginibacter sp. BT774]|uniref:hypothetical protein n=1 Tax=Mucilaginibacter sp. BT774 TaxID=3062276 RepID=UPI002675EEE8|nr:hypothetical protein [Mucilaginibacter sp. BT774]MDO3628865.1 hypothetical protein [Mucilaginibacter sp. BT774]